MVLFFNIWLKLTGAASDPLVLLLRYCSIASSLIDGSTEALLILPTDRMLACMYECMKSTDHLVWYPWDVRCVWNNVDVKFSEYVTFGFILISNEILEFIRWHVVWRYTRSVITNHMVLVVNSYKHNVKLWG